MNLNAWQQVANLKCNLLDVTSLLLEDHVMKREILSRRIFEYVEDLNGLEEVIINESQKCETNNLPVYYKAWEDIAALKAKLLNIGNELLIDQGIIAAREEIALELIVQIETLNIFEGKCMTMVRKNVFIPLSQKCDVIATEREQILEKKQKTTHCNELFNANA